ncbi:MAG: hypothetical protein K2L19_05710 [Eubacterium sp.]|nr:hypothetical protein [Eubacterium sp.]
MKNFLKAIASIILSAISAYSVYILLLMLDVVSYYELTEHSIENIESDLTIIIAFILFNIIYGLIFFHQKKNRC